MATTISSIRGSWRGVRILMNLYNNFLESWERLEMLLMMIVGEAWEKYSKPKDAEQIIFVRYCLNNGLSHWVY